MNAKRLRVQITRHEDWRRRTYTDTEGHPTVGVGFNLDREDARARLAAVGADYDLVRSGEQDLTDDQVAALLEGSIADAAVGAQLVIGAEYWHRLPEAAQDLMIELCFNMGAKRLSGFQKMLMAVRRHDWSRAAAELEDSLWFRQVKTRGPEMVSELAALTAV